MKEKIRESVVDVVGIGWFIAGICYILKGFTLISLAWLILGCLWICVVLFRVLTERPAYTINVLIFTAVYLLGYLIGSSLGIWKFKSVGLIYWYLGGIICGSIVYHIQKRERKKK
jgi:hypothetical protein